MREKEPQFTVTDRRKFTAEGELRDDERQQSPSAPASAPPERPPQSEAPPVAAQAQADLHETPESNNSEAEEMPEPTTEETAQQSKDYAASSQRLDEMLQQANPTAPAGGAMTFDRLVQSLYMTAAVQMGAGTAPNEQPRIDIVGARQTIDMLSVLEDKSKGNLTEDEKRLLQNALFDLRMSFLEITNAIAGSAQRQPSLGKVR